MEFVEPHIVWKTRILTPPVPKPAFQSGVNQSTQTNYWDEEILYFLHREWSGHVRHWTVVNGVARDYKPINRAERERIKREISARLTNLIRRKIVLRRHRTDVFMVKPIKESLEELSKPWQHPALLNLVLPEPLV
ncbi:MAG: hypothetical protein JWM68_1883 [Verrucomicrobiales bacterium]|nr:hypothetical protein [Verrucomicrobiales bacterium]